MGPEQAATKAKDYRTCFAGYRFRDFLLQFSFILGCCNSSG